MRALALSITALGLAACDSGTVPPPGETVPVEDTAPLADNRVALRGDGLTAGAESFYFAAGESEVRKSLTQALGEPGRESANGECGAGPMRLVGYPGGLTVNFRDGRLVGWALSQSGERVQVASDVEVGDLSEVAEAAPGFTPIGTGSMGEEFTIGPDIGGFIADDRVAMLYAGAQCFFR